MGWRLLIIEDDLAIADSLADFFSVRGYAVDTAGNGSHALDLVRRAGLRPDAILLDWLMPIMNGGAFLRERAAERLLASVPIIVITAQPHAAAAASVFARFAKPLPIRALLDAVERACIA